MSLNQSPGAGLPFHIPLAAVGVALAERQTEVTQPGTASSERSWILMTLSQLISMTF